MNLLPPCQVHPSRMYYNNKTHCWQKHGLAELSVQNQVTSLEGQPMYHCHCYITCQTYPGERLDKSGQIDHPLETAARHSKGDTLQSNNEINSPKYPKRIKTETRRNTDTHPVGGNNPSSSKSYFVGIGCILPRLAALRLIVMDSGIAIMRFCPYECRVNQDAKFEGLLDFNAMKFPM